MNVSTFVDDIQRTYPEVTDANVLLDLNIVHEELCKLYRIKVGEEVLSSFVAETRKYNMPSNVAQVYSADFYTSSDSYFPLEPTTVQTLDNYTRGWRSFPSGTPTQYFIDGFVSSGTVPQIGFYPTPDTTTSSSYPQCRMDVAYFEELVQSGAGAGQSSIMPPNVPDYDAWKYGTYKRIAERLNDFGRLQYWAQAEKYARSTLNDVLAMAEDVTPQGVFFNNLTGARRI